MNFGKIDIENRSYVYYSYQSIVIGFGAAALNGALSLYKNGVKDIAIITEGRMTGTSRNTGSDKQTYYKLSLCGDEEDSIAKMANVLYEGGSVDGDTALAEAAGSVRSFFNLVDAGVPFPFNESGEMVGYKTDHDPNKRGTSAGPLTSKYMVEALEKQVESFGISVYDKHQVIELLTKNDGDKKRVCGVLTIDLSKESLKDKFVIFMADNIIYATGGEAGLYESSVYPPSQTGGMGAAFRAGAKGKNLTESQYGIASIKFRWNLSGSFQQVIPRYVSTDADGNDKKEFLDEYFEDKASLLNNIFLKGYQWPFDPRKLVERGSSMVDLLVYQETVLKGRRVFLDYRYNPSCSEENGKFIIDKLSKAAKEYLVKSDAVYNTPIERLEHMNKAAIDLYKSHGIDLHKEMLEIAVCAQHNNGGLCGNKWWESNISHLFPVGEVNGSHGVYRPGGSALNAGQVGSFRAALYISNMYKEEPLDIDKLTEDMKKNVVASANYGATAINRKSDDIFSYEEEKKKLGRRMSECGAVIRDREKIERAIEEAKAQLEGLGKKIVASVYQLSLYYKIRDLLTSQQVYLSAILDYINQGGCSRGSYLIHDNSGIKPFDDMPELFRFKLESGDFNKKVQEICIEDGENVITWRDVRPIPQDDTWFERVWKNCKEGLIYK